MRIAYTAKGEGKHFPAILFALVHFGHGKFGRYLITSNHGMQRNAIPNDSGISN
jgi:hypothetical protein